MSWPQVQRHRLPGGVTLQALHWPCGAWDGAATPRTPSAPPVVLVHGLADCSWVWQGMAPLLAQYREVWALDLRGHGGSDHVEPGGYSVSTMAEDVLAFVAQIGLVQPWLVGHSLGAAVALRAAAQDARCFSALALVDYAVEVPANSLKLIRAVLASVHTTYASTEAFAELLRRRHPLACGQLVRAIAAGALRPAEGGFLPRFDPAVLSALSHGDRLGDTSEPLARLQLPVLVVRGALSSMVSSEGARALAATCLQARLAVVPLAGHSVQIDNPAGLLKALQVESAAVLAG